MAQTKSTPASANDSPFISESSSMENLTALINSRRAHNLHIALCGAIGSNLSNVIDQLKTLLEPAGYDFRHIKVSAELATQVAENYPTELEEISSRHEDNQYDSYRKKQELGKFLREETEHKEICAVLAANKIFQIRREIGLEFLNGLDSQDPQKQILQEQDPTLQNLQISQAAGKRKIVFVIDQLKTPEEAKLLRQIYQGSFYLIAVVDSKENRKQSLENAGLSPTESESLIEIDKNERTEYGQSLEDTVLEADYFINAAENSQKLKIDIDRFLSLIHNANGYGPTQEEYGMFQAYSAGVGSLCLSRQVGAAILDAKGNILATGRNDVPKYGGGLYETTNIYEDTNDYRCVHSNHCSNDTEKQKLVEKITKAISDNLANIQPADDAETQSEAIVTDNSASAIILNNHHRTIVSKAIESSPIKNLIEFSRSVHAEMDAIVSIARKGIQIPTNAILYTTTYPCHNCARHIVAAGISQVVFLEPYEKSLATNLHSDSIVLGESTTKMGITFFKGVSPRRYRDLFIIKGDRKNEGQAIKTKLANLDPAEDFYVNSYIELEAHCVNAYLKSLSVPETD